MKALILEDDHIKAKKIADVFVSRGWQYVHADCAAKCCELMRSEAFEIVVLDLLVPWETSSKDNPDLNNSKIVVSEIRDNRCLTPGFVLGISQDIEVCKEASIEFQRSGWIVLHYDSGVDWKSLLEDRIKLAEQLAESSRSVFGLDIAVVTALNDPETRAFLALVPEMKKVDDTIETYTYYKGVIEDKSVLLFTSVEMGVAASASLSSLICSRFRPKIIVMCGIAAGIDESLSIGDVVICDSVWNYASGKISDKKGVATKIISLFGLNGILKRWAFHPTLQKIDADIGLIQWIKDLENSMASAWWNTQEYERFNLQVGPVACGPWVVANRAIIEWLLDKERKILSLEMELYGVYLAGKISSHPRPKYLGMKGISDFANSKKNDNPDGRILAAKNSVRVFRRLVSLGIVEKCGVVGRHE